MIRVGLVGFGSIAEHGHLPALQSFAGVEVVAVADLSPDRRARAAELLPSAALYDSPAALIDAADITAVDICTPPGTHADLIVAACERGLDHVVCEKPFVLTRSEYERVASARAAAGNRVVSVNNWMHSYLNAQVMRVLRNGAIGSVESVVLRTARKDAALGNAGWNPRWRTDLRHAGGGIILDHGWHQLYLLLGWIGQSPLSVGAVTRTIDSRHAPVEDDAVVDIRFPTARGRIELSWTADERANDGLICGTAGSIEVRDDGIVVRAGGMAQDMQFKERLTRSSYHPDWFEQMFRYNVVHIDRTEADRNFAEAGVLVEIISAAYRSGKQGGAMIELAGVAPGVRSGEGLVLSHGCGEDADLTAH